MDSAKSGQDQQIRCASCGHSTPSYEIVNYGSMEQGYRQLCRQCLNREMAEAMGLEGFEHAKFEPVGLANCTGEVHEFHFRTNLFGTGVALDAFELRDGSPAGYQFQIIGNPEDDLLVLFGKLIQKMRRGLSTKHLVDGQYGLQIADHRVVRGKIEWDVANDGRVPLLIIDGREITWDELGRMLILNPA
jgi:ribosomal protein S14